MSEGTANRRITAVRLIQRIPALVGHLEHGRLTLSALMLIRNLVTAANVEALVEMVSGKKTGQIEELVASMDPKPDVPARLILLPTSPALAADVAASAAEPCAQPSPMSAAEAAVGLVVGATAPRPEPRARLAPLAVARWRLQLTADQALHDKINRARELMRHRNPSGDLTVVVAAAFDALLAKLEAPRAAREKQPDTPPQRRRTVKAGAVAAATRAEVFARDGEQCTYRNARGARCPSKEFLEIDHIDPRARGGSGNPANLRVRCRAHNRLHAEDSFGRSYIEERIREGRRKRAGGVRPVHPAREDSEADEPR